MISGSSTLLESTMAMEKYLTSVKVGFSKLELGFALTPQKNIDLPLIDSQFVCRMSRLPKCTHLAG